MTLEEEITEIKILPDHKNFPTPELLPPTRAQNKTELALIPAPLPALSEQKHFRWG